MKVLDLNEKIQESKDFEDFLRMLDAGEIPPETLKAIREKASEMLGIDLIKITGEPK